jgi:ABC-type amino acid transport system permease subunit
MKENRRKRLLWTGLIGSGVVALCCVTPILVLLLGVIGLGAITGYLDYVLLPALAVFLGLAVYAGARKR